MKFWYKTTLIACLIFSLVFSFTFIYGHRNSIQCSSSINQEVVLMAEYATMKDSRNLSECVGVVSFKIEDVLYGIGHGCNLDKSEEYSVYKINPLFLERTEEHLGSVLYYPYGADEKFIGYMVSDNESGMIISCNEFDSKEYQTISIADEIVSGDAEILIRDELGRLNAYSAKVNIIVEFGKAKLNVYVTDDKLEEMTNGIISGMSGSPIIQEGKLIGVLSHTYLDNPNKGIGQIIWNIDCIQDNIKTEN